ncbi:DUF5696 domain-containing protein [Coraliomargarita sp. SDUM461003]|uniref:DUF5696 domain-containing protein n=1 Tax=Thalassobacterium maritimum TaxID=3041265 RepID=A0ABU1B0G1_9BACT|nr:DUF5696 domain-containing protein [Coraliomargarita sp. SDUM461003]MDQ8208865.1 DUF5696 domain-containing protein [Coraliomargarita sp. SDUM461003]
METQLWSAENDSLSVVVYSDASVVIVDKVNDAIWRMGAAALQEEGPINEGHVWLRTERSICEQYPGRFRGECEGDLCRFTLLGREGEPRGDFRCRFVLDGPWFDCQVVDIDEALPSLVFPTPIESESLVVPQGVGRWIRKPLSQRHFWVFPAHLSMRWFGGLRGRHGWIGVVDQGYQDAGVMAANMTATTGWLKSMNCWQGQRSVRFRFVEGNYVELAKVFRAYAKAKGLFRSLVEKAKATPALANMIGSRALFLWQCRTIHPECREDRMQPLLEGEQSPYLKVHQTHEACIEMVEAVKDAGMTRGLVTLCGWINGGYDESHPDVWPPEPALGSIDSLKKLLSQPDPLTVALHDNYQDIYKQSPSWPQGVVQMPSGMPMPGGYWAGGQAYILNSKNSLDYLRRNWEHIGKLPVRAVYCDTTTAVQFYESYEPGNEQTRSQDEAGKIELLKFYKEQAVVLGSEGASDFSVPDTDFLLPFDQEHVTGETIPLWGLVFHEASIRYTVSNATKSSPEALRKLWLSQMVWGHQMRWYFASKDEWEQSRTAFSESFYVDDWLNRVATSEMVSHRFLADEVEETVFDNGLTLRVNFSSQDYQQDGVCIPALDYQILEGR